MPKSDEWSVPIWFSRDYISVSPWEDSFIKIYGFKPILLNASSNWSFASSSCPCTMNILLSFFFCSKMRHGNSGMNLAGFDFTIYKNAKLSVRSGL